MLLFSVVKVCNYLSVNVFVNYSSDVGMAFTFLFVRVAISNNQGMCITNYSLYTAGVIYALMVPNSSSAKSINISNPFRQQFLFISRGDHLATKYSENYTVWRFSM